MTQAPDQTPIESLSTRDAFVSVAAEHLRARHGFATPCELSLIDLGGLLDLEKRLPAPAAYEFLQRTMAELRPHAMDSESVGVLAPGKLCVIHEPAQPVNDLMEGLERRAREIDPAATGLDVGYKMVSLDPGPLPFEAALAALMHLLDRFVAGPGIPEIASLADGREAMARHEKEQIDAFRCTVLGGSLAVALQPVVNLSNRAFDHHEALARFEAGNENGSPKTQLDFAEDAGLIAEFDYAMVNHVITLITSFSDGEDMPAVAVNLSACSLGNPHFLKSLVRLLNHHENAAGSLGFEVTNTRDIENLAAVRAALQELRRVGARVGLDDFGVDGADINVFRRLDVDYVKIDGDYVKSVFETPRATSFLKSITGLCDDLEIMTIAKGVESEPTLDFLADVGFNYGQGYLFGRPRLASEVLSEDRRISDANADHTGESAPVSEEKQPDPVD